LFWIHDETLLSIDDDIDRGASLEAVGGEDLGQAQARS